MRKTSVIFIRIILLFLTISMIESGKWFLASDSNVHHFIVTEEQPDPEIADYNLASLLEDIILLNITVNPLDLSSISIQKILSEFNPETKDFSGSVWQPPKLSLF